MISLQSLQELKYQQDHYSQKIEICSMFDYMALHIAWGPLNLQPKETFKDNSIVQKTSCDTFIPLFLCFAWHPETSFHDVLLPKYKKRKTKSLTGSYPRHPIILSSFPLQSIFFSRGNDETLRNDQLSHINQQDKKHHLSSFEQNLSFCFELGREVLWLCTDFLLCSYVVV